MLNHFYLLLLFTGSIQRTIPNILKQFKDATKYDVKLRLFFYSAQQTHDNLHDQEKITLSFLFSSAHYYVIHDFNSPVKRWPTHVRNMGRHLIYPSSDWKQETLSLDFDRFW